MDSFNLNKSLDVSKDKKLLRKVLVISVITLLLSNAVLAVMLYISFNKKATIVALTPDMTPVPTEVKKGTLGKMVDYEKFIRIFLNQIYDWDHNSYKEQIKKVLPIMSGEAREDYLAEIEGGGYIEQVKEYKLTSSLVIRTVEDLRSYKDGYRITVQGEKILVKDFSGDEDDFVFSDNKTEVKIDVAFRVDDISEDNYWGLEIFEIKERSK